MAPDNPSDRSNSADSQSQPSQSPPRPPRPFAAVYDIPRAIFDHGAEHGREWRRVYRGEERDTPSDSDKKRRCRRAWSRREAEESPQKSTSPVTWQPESNATANAASRDDDWYNWTRKELEKGEKRAKEMYESWNTNQQNPSSTSSPNKPADSSHSDSWQGWPLARLEDFFKQIRGPQPEQPSPETVFKNLMKSHTELEQQMSSMFPAMLDIHGPFSRGLWPPFKTAHVMSYAASSEYSPLVLETEAGFDSTWRARFEDLIRAEQGSKMLDAKEARITCKQTQWEWLWRFEPQDSEPNDDSYNKFLGFGNEQKSELDAYEHFLSGQKMSPNEMPSNEPQSVYRTVNSYTEPDGSIKTTKITRKVYPDGRVEENQKTETIPPPSQEQTAQPFKPVASAEEKAVSRPSTEKKKGWFWSN